MLFLFIFYYQDIPHSVYDIPQYDQGFRFTKNPEAVIFIALEIG